MATCLQSINIYAANPESNQNGFIQYIEIGNSPINPGKKPKLPSKQRIDCIYDGEYLHLNFLIPEGNCNMILYDAYNYAYNTYYYNSADESISVRIGIVKNTTITIHTEKGNTYSGVIE